MTATRTARQAARSEPMKGLAHLGLAARATIYILIGWLALLLARGVPTKSTDQRGAMQELASQRGGSFLLWVVAIGLAGYAVWRWSEAAFGVAGEGRKRGPRIQSFVRGCVYAFCSVNPRSGGSWPRARRRPRGLDCTSAVTCCGASDSRRVVASAIPVSPSPGAG